MSMLFSYGKVAGYYAAGITHVAQDISPVTQRHVNKWRDFRTHNRVPRRELISGLLVALQRETTILITAAGEPNVKQNEQETLMAGDGADEAIEREVESLDDELDEDDLDEDEDDDDFDDDDDEDDFDDDEDDDDTLDDEELDDELIDLDDEDDDPDFRNKY